MAKTKLTVKSEFGTFTRTTARAYDYLVVVGPFRAEWLEARRLASIKSETEQAARYRRTIATGTDPDWRPAGTIGGDTDRKYGAEFLADGDYAKWADSSEATAAKLTADGPITEDRGKPFVLGWCGRLDLARKLTDTREAGFYRWAKIVDVKTGATL